MSSETMTKEQVIEMFRNMQVETCKIQGFFVGYVTKL